MSPKMQAAFDAFMREDVVQRAIAGDLKKTAADLVAYAFAAGAKFGADEMRKAQKEQEKRDATRTDGG